MSFRLCQLLLLSCSALEDARASDPIRPCNSGECQAGEEESGVFLVQRKGQFLRNERASILNTTDIRKTSPVIGFLKTHKTASSTLTAILQRFAQSNGMSMFSHRITISWAGQVPFLDK